MNYKRAIGIGILVYLVTMILGMIVCSILGITPDPSMMEPIPPAMWLTSAVLAIFLSIAGAFWYFRGKGLQANTKQGARFGLALVLTGFVLDLLFFLSLSFQNYSPVAAIKNYYGQPPFWLTLILILIGATGVGHYLASKKK